MKKLLIVLLILSISLTFLMVAIETSAYNKNYYINSFYKYNIEEETGRSIYVLNTIAEDLILYLKNKGGNELLEPYFNTREILHMQDVQQLFDYARIVKYVFGFIALLILGYLGYKKEYTLIGKTLSIGLFANHILLAFLGLLIISNFNKYFTIFHHIFFTNDLWILDPRTDLMIQMLPEAFFYGMAVRIGLSFFIYLSILQIVGYFYIKKGRGKWEIK